MARAYNQPTPPDSELVKVIKEQCCGNHYNDVNGKFNVITAVQDLEKKLAYKEIELKIARQSAYLNSSKESTISLAKEVFAHNYTGKDLLRDWLQTCAELGVRP